MDGNEKQKNMIFIVKTLVFMTFIGFISLTSDGEKQPNIFFILADDFGWNDIGYHGSEIKTPVLDQLAATGIKLEDYHVQQVCTPSRSQLMTGRYQIHTGLQHTVIRSSQPNALPLKFPTIAEKLKQQGYSTHMIGKWHLGFYKKEFTPHMRGFDTFYGHLQGSENYFEHTRCWEMREKPGYTGCGLDLHFNDELVWNKTGIYSTEMWADRIEEITSRHAKQTPDKPLFVYMPFQSVHEPIQAPQSYIDMYKNIQDPVRQTYAGMVTAMDDSIGRMVESFKTHGLWNNTILIFSTDNGGQVHLGGNNWPLRGCKATLWEGGTRGVGFVHSPLLPEHRKGQVSNGFIHVSDWFPTMLKLGGGSTEGLDLDSFDVWNTIKYGSPSPRRELLMNIDPLAGLHGQKIPQSPFDNRVHAGIRLDNWKLITGNPGQASSWYPPPQLPYTNQSKVRLSDDPPDKNLWLFDIVKDPLETTDVSEKFPDVVQYSLSRLAFYNSTAVPVTYPDDDLAADPRLHGGAWVPWRD